MTRRRIDTSPGFARALKKAAADEDKSLIRFTKDLEDDFREWIRMKRRGRRNEPFFPI